MEITRKRVIILIILVVILAGIIAFNFLYVKKCTSEECFTSAMGKCDKAEFIKEGEEASWLYKITGAEGNILCTFSSGFCENCTVSVTLLQVKKGTSELAKLEGLNMACSLPFGYAGNPQDDLTRCHGLLREEIQEAIISKMHSYILSNVGKIGKELTKVV